MLEEGRPMSSTPFPSSADPVRTTTRSVDIVGLARILRRSSSPFMDRIDKSVSTNENGSPASSRSSAATPSSTVVTTYPCFFSTALTKSRSTGSSSTTRIAAPAVAVDTLGTATFAAERQVDSSAGI
jgi:hypothetical protein